MAEFELQKGEKIIEEIKPSPNLKKILFFNMSPRYPLFHTPLPSYIFVISRFYFIIFTGIAIVLALILNNLHTFSTEATVLYLFIIVVAYPFIAWYICTLNYRKLKYYITNRRIVIKKGIIKDYFISIPYKKSSQVEIYPSQYETYILMITNPKEFPNVSYFSKKGNIEISKATLYGVENPEKIKQSILKFVK